MKRFRSTVLASLIGALVAFVLLTPSRGIDRNPPECYSYFGYVVPCGLGPEQDHNAGFAGAGSAVAALLVIGGSLAGLNDRNRG